MKVSIEPLKKAIASLARSLQKPKDEFIRDSVVQRFEYCFELSWKTLKRYFEWNQNLSEENIKNIFREAGKQGLIDEVELWFEFHRGRNETSHAYDEIKAEGVYLLATRFLPEVQKLSDRLENLIK